MVENQCNSHKLTNIAWVTFPTNFSHKFTLVAHLDMLKSPWNSRKLANLAWVIFVINFSHGFILITPQMSYGSEPMDHILWKYRSSQMSYERERMSKFPWKYHPSHIGQFT